MARISVCVTPPPVRRIRSETSRARLDALPASALISSPLLIPGLPPLGGPRPSSHQLGGRKLYEPTSYSPAGRTGSRNPEQIPEKPGSHTSIDRPHVQRPGDRHRHVVRNVRRPLHRLRAPATPPTPREV